MFELRSGVRASVAAWVAAAIAGAGAWLGGPVASARADGDPASDVLVAAPPVFLGADSGATYAEKLVLQRQLRHAAARGADLRVAVIATRADLGSVTALWGRPREYAEFLGRELSLDFHGELLVVMGDGFGLTRHGVPVPSALAGLAPRRGELITATEQAIAHLTGVPASGAARGAAPGGGASRTAGIGWWAATAAALISVALAWTASLRRRPLRLRRRPIDSSA